MSRLTSLMVVLTCVFGICATGSGAKGDEIPQAAREVRAEAMRQNLDPDGRPLPMAAHWHSGGFPLSMQMKLIRGGHHIMPFVSWYTRAGSPPEGTRQLRKWNLPFAIIHGNQWLSRFRRKARFKELSPEESPLVLSRGGEKMDKISPFGPVQPWEDLGRMLANEAVIEDMQEAYPEPPLVLLVSNNESNRLDMARDDIEISRRYLDLYGEGRSDTFKRRVLANGWIRRYRTLFQGIRDGLQEKGWKANSLIVPYGGGPGPTHYGRPDAPIGDGGWRRWSLATPSRLGWGYYAWEGAMGSYYDNDWESKQTMFNVWSDQTEFMNHVFQKEDALALNPDYWYELIYWDGGAGKAEQYREKGLEPTTPARYRGWVQYGMWLLTPRVAREWESSTTHHSDYWHKMKEVIRAVDLVHADPTLKRFWRRGELVPNPNQDHPFQSDLIEKYKDEERWFRLETNRDPERPWKFTTHLPVWPLARVIGKKPEREWLVYAHAPMGDKEDVGITIPGYDRKITVDVSIGGSFYHVKESDDSVTEVGELSRVDVAPQDP